MKKEVSRDIILNIPGMSNLDNLYDLCRAAEDTHHLEGDMLEIGTWCGRSAISLGYVARELGCKLHCYDIFPPFSYWEKYESLIASGDMAAIRRVYVRGGPLALFMQAIVKHELTSVIEIHPHEFGPANHKLRFAFIDGNHSYEAVEKDARYVTDCLVDKGTLVFDDVTIRYPAVLHVFNAVEGYIGKKKLNSKMGIAERIITST